MASAVAGVRDGHDWPTISRLSAKSLVCLLKAAKRPVGLPLTVHGLAC